jgi:glucose/arabinose dehydrogenase
MSRLFVVEQRGSDNRGRIRIIKNGSLLSTPFLTTAVLPMGFEQGLLGLAFAPDYATTGRFYIHYTDANSNVIIARHTVSANPDVANATGTTLFTIPKPDVNHNGGWMAFGPDGYLYFTVGDGGGGDDIWDNSQNRDILLGKMMRIDVSGSTYTIPPGNPFAGATPGLDEIWATGMRNAWRNSFDRQTGDLIISDVGQNTYEEVNFAPPGTAGANYGWRCYEGFHTYLNSTTNPCASCSNPSCPMILPAYEYEHTAGRCSITGGYVYRGFDIPSLRGTYLFADYCTGEIWSGTFSGGALTGVQDRTVELEPSGLTIGTITSFGEDARGELYICSDDEVYKIIPLNPTDVEPTPPPPMAALRVVGPNPFRVRLQVEATSPEAARGAVDVVDAAGRRVRTLLEEQTWSGSRMIAWDGKNDQGTNAPSGVYWIRFRTGDSVLTQRAVLVR